MPETNVAQKITLSDRIDQLFAERLNLDVPSRETKLIDEGYLDSLSFIDLLMFLEEDFGVVIELHEVDFERFETLNAVTEFVASHSGGPGDG